MWREHVVQYAQEIGIETYVRYIIQRLLSVPQVRYKYEYSKCSNILSSTNSPSLNKP